MQGPPPDYDAVDANYYVTWGHFAEWVNTMLEHLPAEIEALRSDALGATAERSSTRRSARGGDAMCALPLDHCLLARRRSAECRRRDACGRGSMPLPHPPEGCPVCRMLKERISRLQAVHDKFRRVVAEGETMPSAWREATPEHRRAFENFFAGWKPLPPSMAQPQRKAANRNSATSGGSDGGYRGSRRGPCARADAALRVRCSPSLRLRSAQLRGTADSSCAQWAIFRPRCAAGNPVFEHDSQRDCA
jgi:hypothetical protein